MKDVYKYLLLACVASYVRVSGFRVFYFYMFSIVLLNGNTLDFRPESFCQLKNIARLCGFSQTVQIEFVFIECVYLKFLT